MSKIRSSGGKTWTPSKALGQNFLIDGFYIKEILDKFQPNKADHVIEIGSGLGSLTLPLADRVGKVTAIEKDPVLFRILKQKASLHKLNNIEFVLSDALKFPYATLDQPVKIIGNLPYSAATSILLHLINVIGVIEAIFITIQKEVAEKILARLGGKDYGSLSIFVQYYLKGSILFTIPAEAFKPKPGVLSAFVHLSPHKTRPVSLVDEQLFFYLVRKAFSYRRKTLWNNIKEENFLHFTPEIWDEVFQKLNLDAKVRAQDLSLEDFARMSNYLKECRL